MKATKTTISCLLIAAFNVLPSASAAVLPNPNSLSLPISSNTTADGLAGPAGLSWHCFTPQEHIRLTCPSYEYLRHEVWRSIPLTRSFWKSPRAGGYLTWAPPKAECEISLGCTIPYKEGTFHVGDIMHKLAFLHLHCPLHGGRAYLPTNGIREYNKGWYIEIYKPG